MEHELRRRELPGVPQLHAGREARQECSAGDLLAEWLGVHVEAVVLAVAEGAWYVVDVEARAARRVAGQQGRQGGWARVG